LDNDPRKPMTIPTNAVSFIKRLSLVVVFACLFNVLNYGVNHGLFTNFVLVGFALSGTLIASILFFLYCLVVSIRQADYERVALNLLYGAAAYLTLGNSQLTLYIVQQIGWG